jgi:hypothetical protein
MGKRKRPEIWPPGVHVTKLLGDAFQRDWQAPLLGHHTRTLISLPRNTLSALAGNSLNRGAFRCLVKYDLLKTVKVLFHFFGPKIKRRCCGVWILLRNCGYRATASGRGLARLEPKV